MKCNSVLSAVADRRCKFIIFYHFMKFSDDTVIVNLFL